DGQLLVPGGDARRPWRRRRRRRSLGNLPRGPVSASWWRAGQGLELETQLEGAIDGSIDELEGGVAGEGEGRPGVVAAEGIQLRKRRRVTEDRRAALPRAQIELQESGRGGRRRRRGGLGGGLHHEIGDLRRQVILGAAHRVLDPRVYLGSAAAPSGLWLRPPLGPVRCVRSS